MERLKTAPLWVWEELLQQYRSLARNDSKSGGYRLSPSRRADAEYIYTFARKVVGTGMPPADEAWGRLRQRFARVFTDLESTTKGR